MTDRAFEELQKRCRIMNLKKYSKVLLLMFLIVVMVLFGYTEFFQSKKIKKMIIKPVKKIDTHVKLSKKIEIQKKIVKKNKEVNKSEAQNYNTILLTPTIKIPNIQKTTNTKSMEETKKSEKIETKKVETEKKIILKKKIFIKVKSLEDEKSLIKANNYSESFDTTLALSKFYFQKQKYEKAIIWSKKANHYNPSSFDPWLIYAQAKIKQGKKDEAIRAVETFLSYFSSEEASKFLSSIKKTK